MTTPPAKTPPNPTAAIRANFDRGAAAYQAYEAECGFFRGLTLRLLEAAPRIEIKRALDVGCGTGASTEALLNALGGGVSVVGLDISLGMLKEARANAGGAAAFLCMDGTSFGSGLKPVFDLVLYNAVLFMLPDAAASLRSAHGVLRSGGVAAASTLEGVWAEGVPIPEMLKERGYAAGTHALSPWAKVSGAAEELFGEISKTSYQRPMSGEDFLAFYGQEPMSAGLLPRMPYPERRKVLADFADELTLAGKKVVQEWTLVSLKKAS